MNFCLRSGAPEQQNHAGGTTASPQAQSSSAQPKPKSGLNLLSGILRLSLMNFDIRGSENKDEQYARVRNESN